MSVNFLLYDTILRPRVLDYSPFVVILTKTCRDKKLCFVFHFEVSTSFINSVFWWRLECHGCILVYVQHWCFLMPSKSLRATCSHTSPPSWKLWWNQWVRDSPRSGRFSSASWWKSARTPSTMEAERRLERWGHYMAKQLLYTSHSTTVLWNSDWSECVDGAAGKENQRVVLVQTYLSNSNPKNLVHNL